MDDLEAIEQEVVWSPTERQALFLAADEDEVLFGGAAGGGKSDAMLIDALGIPQDAMTYNRYRALITRCSMPELRDLIDRSRTIYPLVVPGITFHEQAKEWRAPSGAKIIFGYCEKDADVYQYQGQEFQWIGRDELQHDPTSFIWDYLSSRLRTTREGFRCYMRATCNPGPKWIRERWGIDIYGNAASKNIDVELKSGAIHTKRMRFIPSRLSDNHHLGADYEARLQMLPIQERAKLLEGRWDVLNVDGAILAPQLVEARAAGRVTSVPYDERLPVYTYWDLGMGDATAVLFVQVYGKGEFRVIDYMEGDALTVGGLPGWIHEVQKRCRSAQNPMGYVVEQHYAPHDIEVREFGTGVSRLETAQRMGMYFERRPRAASHEDKIHAARMAMPKTWFDEKKCERLLECLTNWRLPRTKTGEFGREPVHDEYSHGADAFCEFARHMDVQMAIQNGKNVREIKYKRQLFA